jgi:hypothetical protein
MKRLLPVVAILALGTLSDARVPQCADGRGLGPHRTRQGLRVKVRGTLIDVVCDVDERKDDGCTFLLRDPFCFPDFCTDLPVTTSVRLGGRRRATTTTVFREGVALRLRCVKR